MIKIAALQQEDMKIIWQNVFKEHKSWMDLDAPFLHKRIPLTFHEFSISYRDFYDNVPFKQGIFLGSSLIGIVSFHWENKATRWLEFGIILFDESHWGHGYGKQALTIWISKLFMLFPEVKRVGCSTWSKNIGMMKLAESLGMVQEACLRSVRYYEGVYYDAIKYGVLRHEWQKKVSEGH